MVMDRQSRAYLETFPNGKIPHFRRKNNSTSHHGWRSDKMKLRFSQTSQEQGVGCSGKGPLGGAFPAGPHEAHILSSSLRPMFPQTSQLCGWRRTRRKRSVSHMAPSAVSQKRKAPETLSRRTRYLPRCSLYTPSS